MTLWRCLVAGLILRPAAAGDAPSSLRGGLDPTLDSLRLQGESPQQLQAEASHAGMRVRKAKLHHAHKTVLRNHGDLQYVGDIKVGGQSIKGVLDTGSFELLVFSAECEACGNTSRLYDHRKSGSYVSSDYEMRHSFGSGDTWSHEAHDSVEVGNLVAYNQSFWEVYRTAMPVIQHAAFQAIVGLGPMRSASRLAKQQHQAVLEEEREFLSTHAKVPARMQQDEEDAKEAVDHSRKLSGLLQNIGVNTFSVCIGRKLGGDGYFMWNDQDPQLRPDIFTKVSDVNSMHWVVELSDVRIGTGMSGDSNVFDVDCGEAAGHRCGAIMDTGTSLIAAPSEAINRVVKMVDRIDGNCSRIGELPDLRFQLGGAEFTLPPESYIGRVQGQVPTALGEIFHLRHKLNNASHSQLGSCQPLLMAVESLTQHGPMWIMGLPFFRRYYTTFDSRTSLVRFGTIARKQFRNSIYIAQADEDCNPLSGTSLLGGAEQAREIMTVDLTKVRYPTWATESTDLD